MLSDAAGNPLADHDVAIDREASAFDGFVDLHRFVRRHSDPDQRQASEAELVAQTGRWIGVELLGRVGEVLLERAPTTVEVIVPSSAEWLMFRPWEVAEIGGVKLAQAGVSFVFVLDGQRQRDKAPIGPRLRMLAAFSSPSEQAVLALRQERYALQRLVRTLAGRGPRAIELHVLQYGVTRERFQHAAEDGEGWDILHMSGHGLADGLMLERPDGSSDLVRTTALLELLRPMRGRTKLAVLSSCQSAAARTAETLRWLRLEQPAQALEAEADEDGGEDGVPALGCAVMKQLDCAVIAMRFPVSDRFAIRFADKLYQLLLDRGQPLDEAVRNALPLAVASDGAVEMPAISIGTPALFGQRAGGLVLRPPEGRAAGISAGGARMAGFPEEPVRFVGRAGLMATATTTLASASGRSGVIFNGTAGAGKTACALELAYRHESGFAAHVFWRGPQSSEEALGALPQFAQRMETLLGPQLAGGFEMIHGVSSDAELDRFLPQLTQLLETTGLLIVLDNLETLLTDDGAWRDPRWERLIHAMSDHRGLTRLVMTSRVVPSGLPTGIKALPVGALTLAEAALLARELPNLGALLDPPQTDARDDDAAAGRALVRRALAVVQGHPKLLELADAAAADVDQLAARVSAAEQDAAKRGAPLEAFFLEGESELGPQRFIEALASWTRNATSALDEGSLLLLQYLCCLEEHDRIDIVIADTWQPLWRRLGQTGQAPPLQPLVDGLVAAALIDSAQVGTIVAVGDGARRPAFGYGVHPGVAESVRGAAGSDLQAQVDANASGYWIALSTRGIADEEQHATGGIVLRSAMAALPYLLRLERWDAAAQMLSRAVTRAGHRGVLLRLVPYLRQVGAVVDDPHIEGMLGTVLRDVEPVEAERRLRRSLERSLADDDHSSARASYASLANLMLSQGAFRDALALCDERAERLPAAEGSWHRFTDDVQRVQVQSMLDPPAEVLAEVTQLIAQMDTFTDTSSSGIQWGVRETLFDTGHTVAIALRQWQAALDFNNRTVTSLRGRGAGEGELALALLNNVGPLAMLGHLRESERVLDECQQVFEVLDHTSGLSLVYATRGSIEQERGHIPQAVELTSVALRLAYAESDPYRLQSCHHNVGLALDDLGSDRDGAFAHVLAAVLLCHWCRMRHEQAVSMRLLARLRRDSDGALQEPASVEALAQRLDAQPGVYFGLVAERLVPSAAERDGTLVAMLAESKGMAARTQAAEVAFDEAWRTFVAALVAAVGGDRAARSAVEQALDGLSKDDDAAALAGALRRILAGERGTPVLDGLDAGEAAMVRELLDQLGD